MTYDLMNIGQVVATHAALTPERIAVKDLQRSLTYREYNRWCCRLANAFSEVGIQQGDRIAIYAYNRLEWMILYAACAKAGVVAVPVNFRLTAPELTYQVQDSGAKALFFDASLQEHVEAARSDLAIADCALIRLGDEGLRVPAYRSFDELCFGASDKEPEVQVRPEDTWTIMYTSGTTGRPKGAVRSHRSYVLFYLMNALEFGFVRDDSGLCVMPLCHVNSVFYGFVFTYLGATVCVYDRRSFDPEHLLHTFDTYGITFTSLVPTHYAMMLALPSSTRERYDVRTIRKLLISSAPARRETKVAAMEYFRNSQLFEAYGSTEAGLVTLLRPEEQLSKLGSIGREIVGTGPIMLLDEDGNHSADGEVGELFARTPTAFDGYWGMAEATQSALRGPYCTAGDLARRDADGFFTLVDRKSNMIITGGEKVYPSEVETVLAAHPAVRDVAVIGVPDDKWGESVTAVVVLRDGVALDASALLEQARRQLAGYKCPKSICFIGDSEMPRTATGKILHRELRRKLGTRVGV